MVKPDQLQPKVIGELTALWLQLTNIPRAEALNACMCLVSHMGLLTTVVQRRRTRLNELMLRDLFVVRRRRAYMHQLGQLGLTISDCV